MERRQLARFHQLLEGRRLGLLAAVRIEQLALHGRGRMADQLQGQGFDAGGMEAADNVNNTNSVQTQFCGIGIRHSRNRKLFQCTLPSREGQLLGSLGISQQHSNAFCHSIRIGWFHQ